MADKEVNTQNQNQNQNQLQEKDKNKEKEKAQTASPTLENRENNETQSNEGGNEVSQSPQAIVEEFLYLLEKSQQLFAGLRELSPISGRMWIPHFQRTFEIFTKLWKFQQIHRSVLEDKEYYGLKRWEVGEIASKIGQIYYHYYLRTSETNYLHEAYIFYEAIHERGYFKDVLDIKNPAQLIKKLRYYARFIVVGLLLVRKERVSKLNLELTHLVEEYTRSFKPVDSMEWQMVLQEINTFLEAEKKLTPLAEGSSQPLPIQLRYPTVRTVDLLPIQAQNELANKSDKPILPSQSIAGKSSALKLQEVIIVGNKLNQVKFSELSLDMYRMVLTLEREPSYQTKPPSESIEASNATSTPISPPTEAANNPVSPLTQSKHPVDSQKKPNLIRLASNNLRKTLPPHKYLLFRPSFSQLLVYIANCYKDLIDNSVLLIYLSTDSNKSMPSEAGSQYGYIGGCSTSFRKPIDKSSELAESVAASHCLHPGDLIPFTRKPMFIIVESHNNEAFKKIPRLFNQPFLALIAAYDTPFKENSMAGSILTMFLSSPLVGFCHLADLVELTPEVWSKMTEQFNLLEEKVHSLLINHTTLDKGVQLFLNDEFLALLVNRFVIANLVLQCHRLVKDPKNLPSSVPPFPDDIIQEKELLSIIMKVVDLTKTNLIYSNLDKALNQNNNSKNSGNQISGTKD